MYSLKHRLPRVHRGGRARERHDAFDGHGTIRRTAFDLEPIDISMHSLAYMLSIRRLQPRSFSVIIGDFNPVFTLVAASTIVVFSQAQSLQLANASFESPVTQFVDNRVDSWLKTPKPFWYDESGGFAWDQLSGVFKNTAPGSADRIENCVGDQAFYLFAVPQTGIYQDDIAPADTFTIGRSYALTAGLVGGAGGMAPGVSIEMSLYYKDQNGDPVTLGATNVVYDTSRFPNQTNFVDVQLRIPVVRAGDAWAGKTIGVGFLSTVNPAIAGGYWDIDNVRLVASSPAPALLAPKIVNGGFECTLQSEPGAHLEVLASSSATAPVTSWATIATIINTSGAEPFRESLAGDTHRYYAVRLVP